MAGEFISLVCPGFSPVSDGKEGHLANDCMHWKDDIMEGG